ncbi:glycoside hydrolase family 36 protein [Microbacterium sp. 22303]|uniref:glycoside hydrolase family 36 protein n=1 Tax=Microbacterium sp. 22303 TaxID=3453905 RepID=UPI003F87245D
MTDRLSWGNGTLTIELQWSADSAPRIAAVLTEGVRLAMPDGLPLVDVLTVAQGHSLASDRLVHTVIGHEARYAGHEERSTAAGVELRIRLEHAGTGLEIELLLRLPHGLSVLRSSVTVVNRGGDDVVLRSVPSLAVYLGGDGESRIRDWEVRHALSDWLGEGRWVAEPLDGVRFPRLEQHLTNHNPRGEFSVISTGTWSTGKHLPVAAVESARLRAAWAWQVEHNGAWRWEIGEDTASGYVALSGPTDIDHQWTQTLHPGGSFSTVPVALALAEDLTSAIGQLTAYRRASRRAHPDNLAMPVVFNDYMNTLNGDPTTEKLLPLIDAAAAVGAEIFCIDAGWYDDSGDWWDTVGEWVPSTIRFPGGLGEVIDRIRQGGMVPGLWLEPEVIGVNSPMAQRLPDEAFLQRHGERVVEHHRYHLDLRHPAARAHLDDVVDRLVRDFGIGFFKLDYNIDPGPGTDRDADSVGAGLLAHNRAHLEWLDGVLDRHPTLVLENCGSGAMRADQAMLSRLQMQSTSDQQDFLRYPPIAAAAPASILPEQAASWAYPQPEMSEEEVAFCLATGLLGRFYVSGHLGRMDADRRGLVAGAVRAAKSLRHDLTTSMPFWPLGIPEWDAPWTALGLAIDGGALFTVWSRDPGAGPVELDLSRFAGIDLTVTTIFPRSLPEWDTHWNAETGRLRVAHHADEAGARVFRIQAAASSQGMASATATHSASRTQWR